MQCSSKSIAILFSFLLLVQISFSATAKWSKPTSQTYADPVMDGDSIYIATAAGTVLKLDKAGGNQIWTQDVIGTIFVSPLVYDFVYVGTSDSIFALDKADGRIVGNYTTLPQKVLTSPLAVSNRLFVAAESKVFIFDLSSGAGDLKSPLTVTLPSKTDSSAFVDGDGISFFLTDGRLVHVSTSGALDITFNIGTPVWKAGPIKVDDVIYFGSERKFYALSSTGVILWSQDFNGWLSRPILHSGMIYVGCNDGRLYALNQSTGNIKGSFKTGEAVLAPAVSNNTIYIPSKDNNIYAIDIRTMEQKWNMTLDDWPSTPLLSDSVLYTVSLNGTVYTASTLGCEITDPAKDARVASKARISGIAYSDAGLTKVEVRVGTGAWSSAKLSEGKWSIDYTVTGASDGSKIIMDCRASDSTGTEIEPYNWRTFTYVSSEDSLPKINITYPSKVTSGNEFTVKFNDEEGNTLKGVTLQYANAYYEAEEGTVKVKAVDGETALYVSKPNYKTEVVTIQVEAPSYAIFIIPGAILGVIILVVAILFLTKRWR